MNKIFKTLLIFISLLLLLNCSFKPILKQQDFKYSVIINKIEGNKQVNKLIINNFNKLKNDKYKSYNLEIISEKNKKIISKDSKGDPKIFEVSLIVEYKVLSNDEVLVDKRIVRTNTYDNISDKFELEQNEKILTENLVKNIFNYITLSISSINNDS